MNQDEINKSEWENPDNWASPRWLGIYFSKRDTRIWVPKSNPGLGWTVNFAQPKGIAWFLGLIALIILIAFWAGSTAA